MGYIFFIIIAFSLLGLEKLIGRGDRHETTGATYPEGRQI